VEKDEEDSSVTRPPELLKSIFAAANLELYKVATYLHLFLVLYDGVLRSTMIFCLPSDYCAARTYTTISLETKTNICRLPAGIQMIFPRVFIF
jgi:hypothetical protein